MIAKRTRQYPIEFQAVLIGSNLQIVFGFVIKIYY